MILEYVHNTGTAQIDFISGTSTVPQQTVGRGQLYPPPSESTTLTPIDDAFVQGGSSADINFGTAEQLLAKVHPSESTARDSYLKFDLTNTQVITKVRLRVFGELSSGANANVPIGVFNAGKTKWSEGTITYNDRPVVGDKQAEALVSVHTGEQWWEFDLTNWLRAEKAIGNDVVTLVLRNLQQSVTTTSFASKEASANGPQLIVTS
jgi:hypothetical protein